MINAGEILYLGVSDTPGWVVAKANQCMHGQKLRRFLICQGRWSAASRDLRPLVCGNARLEADSSLELRVQSARYFTGNEDECCAGLRHAQDFFPGWAEGLGLLVPTPMILMPFAAPQSKISDPSDTVVGHDDVNIDMAKSDKETTNGAHADDKGASDTQVVEQDTNDTPLSAAETGNGKTADVVTVDSTGDLVATPEHTHSVTPGSATQPMVGLGSPECTQCHLDDVMRAVSGSLDCPQSHVWGLLHQQAGVQVLEDSCFAFTPRVVVYVNLDASSGQPIISSALASREHTVNTNQPD
ncbi:hypothetical protein F5Y16DRAFT_398170 [Xylariaceae sp. FL0255]|nr:hypothetical protein F5Y16DRAFT_398170 [Xylariaceae sp. FL0255]